MPAGAKIRKVNETEEICLQIVHSADPETDVISDTVQTFWSITKLSNFVVSNSLEEMEVLLGDLFLLLRSLCLLLLLSSRFFAVIVHVNIAVFANTT